MKISALISEARASGVRIYLRRGTVMLDGDPDAIAAVRLKLKPYKAEILAHLTQEEEPTGAFWPWAPYLNADDVQRFRVELVSAIEKLADMERWSTERRDDVLARAIRGPLADLLPNLHHFSHRLSEANAEAATRAKVQARSWRFDR